MQGLKTVKLLFPDSMTRILKRLPNHDGLFLPQESFPGAVKIKAMSLLYFLIEHRIIPAKPVEKIYGSEGIFRNPEIIKPNRDKPLIGYCYTTLNNSWNIKMKQIPKELMDNFIKQHPEFDWVSLQQNDGFITSKYWSDTADKIQTLDGVISVDSAIAHCAGSVGVPVANLVGQEQLACWRWYPKGNTTCWYDSMKTIWFNTWTEGLEEAVKHFKVEKKKKQTKTKKEGCMTEFNTPFSTVGYITYKRTYARRLNEADPASPTEEFEDTVNRVVAASNDQLKCGFTDAEKKRLQKYLMELKGTVAGRFLWQMGTETVGRLGLASLQNCAFTVIDHPVRPLHLGDGLINVRIWSWI